MAGLPMLLSNVIVLDFELQIDSHISFVIVNRKEIQRWKHNSCSAREEAHDKKKIPWKLDTCGFKPFNFPGSLQVVVPHTIEYKSERNQSYQDERHYYHINNHHSHKQQTKLTTENKTCMSVPSVMVSHTFYSSKLINNTENIIWFLLQWSLER